MSLLVTRGLGQGQLLPTRGLGVFVIPSVGGGPNRDYQAKGLVESEFELSYLGSIEVNLTEEFSYYSKVNKELEFDMPFYSKVLVKSEHDLDIYSQVSVNLDYDYFFESKVGHKKLIKILKAI